MLAQTTFLAVTLSLLGSAVYGQNTNNGVILNNTVIFTEPVYQPPVYSPPAPNVMDRALEQTSRDYNSMHLMDHVVPLEYQTNFQRLNASDPLFSLKATGFVPSETNLRSGGSTKARVIALLPAGATVTILQPRSGSKWWMVYYPGTDAIGYIHPSRLQVH